MGRSQARNKAAGKLDGLHILESQVERQTGNGKLGHDGAESNGW